MSFLILWLVTIAISYFIARNSMSVEPKLLGDEPVILFLFILGALIPFLNILIHIIVNLIARYLASDVYGVDELAQRIFNSKSKREKNNEKVVRNERKN